MNNIGISTYSKELIKFKFSVRMEYFNTFIIHWGRYLTNNGLAKFNLINNIYDWQMTIINYYHLTAKWIYLYRYK